MIQNQLLLLLLLVETHSTLSPKLWDSRVQAQLQAT
uniref:A.thaliana phyE protein n=1 Tax=Arabidopsis thaliana TaxID=3702 RepID=A2NXL8_ARATH|nr:unnamed protein product [Arabidopsis thaliana]